jgi:hypothetical protein
MLRTGAVSNAMVKIVSRKTVFAGIGTACRYCCSNNFVLFVYTASQKYEFQMLYLFVFLLTYFPFSVFDPRAIHVGCGANRMALGQVFL